MWRACYDCNGVGLIREKDEDYGFSMSMCYQCDGVGRVFTYDLVPTA